MKLEDQVVSRDVAKALRDVGVSQDSCFYWINTTAGYRLTETENAHQRYDGVPAWIDEPDTYAAFSVAELGEMLPLCCMSWSTPQTGEMTWWCRINETHMVVHKERPIFTAAKEADARAKMLLHVTTEAHEG